MVFYCRRRGTPDDVGVRSELPIGEAPELPVGDAPTPGYVEKHQPNIPPNSYIVY